MRLSPSVVVCTVSVAALAFAGTAWAEGEPEGEDPYYDANGVFHGGGNTNGFVLQDGAGWGQVCAESFDDSGFPADFSTVLPDGTLVVGGIPGLGISTDGGCTFALAPELAGRHVSALASAGGTLYVATEDNGQPNGLYLSIDGGQQWTEALTPRDGLLIFEVIASRDGSRLALSGMVITGTPGPAVFVSTDSGLSFQDVSAGYAGLPRVRAAAFDSDDTALLLGGFDGTGAGIVMKADPPYDAPTQIGSLPTEVRHIAVLGGARYALAYLAGALFRQGPAEAGFTQLTDKTTGPSSCLYEKADGSGLIGCGKQGSRQPRSPMFLESSDGATWTVVVDFPGVHYRTCPAGTPGNGACARFLEGTQCTDGVDNDFDGFADCDDDECASTPACGGTGEGEGEGGAGEGEGEGEGEPPAGTCACAGVDGGGLVIGLLLLLRRPRLRAASSAS